MSPIIKKWGTESNQRYHTVHLSQGLFQGAGKEVMTDFFDFPTNIQGGLNRFCPGCAKVHSFLQLQIFCESFFIHCIFPVYILLLFRGGLQVASGQLGQLYKPSSPSLLKLKLSLNPLHIYQFRRILSRCDPTPDKQKKMREI